MYRLTMTAAGNPDRNELMDAVTVTASAWIAPMPLTELRDLTPRELVDYAREDGVIITGGPDAVADAIVARLDAEYRDVIIEILSDRREGEGA